MHTQYLLQALTLAESRRGCCAPNPSVGAVIVKDGCVLAQGCHWQAGDPHAEVHALNQITSEQAQGATLYITLEPCAHFGKTPPCVDAIIRAGIHAVYYAFADPNPEVQGIGIAKLVTAGIHTLQMTVPEINEFYTSYAYWWRTRRPTLTAKLALSLDGKLAGLDGQPVAITNATTQRWTHQQRLRSDAILSTQRTIQFDNPSLNVRTEEEVIAKPLYLLDTQCAFSPSAKLFTTAKSLTILCANTASHQAQDQLRAQGIRVMPLATHAGKLDLKDVLRLMGNDGLFDVWLECGARALSAFLQAELIQTLHVCVAPKFLGPQSTQAELPGWDFVTRASKISIHSTEFDTIYTMKFTLENDHV